MTKIHTNRKISQNIFQQNRIVSLFVAITVFIYSLYVAFTIQNNTFAHQLASNSFNQPTMPVMQQMIPTLTLTPTIQPSPTHLPLPTPTSLPISNVPYVPVANDFCLNVPILMYHHIENIQNAQKEGHAPLTVADTFFDQQMQYLSTHGYTTIALDQLIDAIYAHKQVTVKSIVVTLDDGYSDWYTYAYPIMQKYHITGNLMIASGLINNPGYLTWDQLKEMYASGNEKIFNHTWSHIALGTATKTKIEYEMTTSNTQLESMFSKPITIMAYPYGSFNDLTISILQEHHFIAALTTLPGKYECLSNIFRLPRVRIGNAPMSSYGF